MSVVLETTLGDVTIDLFVKERPRACLNFLKLCKIKYYNFNLFHMISRDFIAQTGDPTGSRSGGESVFGVLQGPLKRYFEAEKNPRIKHTTMGLVSFVGEDHMIGSQFFITLGPDLSYLDEQHCVFGEVMEGLDVLELLNESICDQDNRPYQDVRITHTVILDDPFPDPEHLRVPGRSPSPNAERMQGGRIAPDEDIDEAEGKTHEEVNEIVAEREAKARATILEMVGDIPDADMAPPENVLFVCKLNPVTTDDDLEIIFSRFGKIKSCEVIRDKKTGDSLQYAFVEFDERKSCEDAYFKMDNVLIDDRRIHVDFSQSVAKVKWHGKGRGVTTYDDKGRKSDDARNDVGNGKYKKTNGDRNHEDGRGNDRHFAEKSRERRRSPSRNRYEKYASDRRYGSESKSRNRHGERESDRYYKTDRYHTTERYHKTERYKEDFRYKNYDRSKYERRKDDDDKSHKNRVKESTNIKKKKKKQESSSDDSSDDSSDEKTRMQKSKQRVKSTKDVSSDEDRNKKKKREHKKNDYGNDERRMHKKRKKKHDNDSGSS